MTQRTRKIILFLVFAAATAIILLNRLTSLYINSTAVHFIFFFLSLGSIVIILGEYLFDLKKAGSIAVTLILVVIACFLKAFFTWGGDWKTQTILFKAQDAPSHTIELQMRGDRFAFGYKNQIVERQPIVPYFDWVEKVDTSKVSTARWKRVDESVNEMKLPEN